MIPTLVVLVGYLAADIFLSGYAAAILVISLGLGEFLFLLIFRGTKHPSLILEGAVLAGAGLFGEVLAAKGYNGSGYILLEIIFAGVLLISTARGKPWLASQIKRFAGFSAGKEFSRDMSVGMGFLFLTHSILLTIIMFLKGSVHVFPAALSFIMLYIVTVYILRKRQKRFRILTSPQLQKVGEGEYYLEIAGDRLAGLSMYIGVVTDISAVDITEDCQIHQFLESLEECLKASGCRAVRFTMWDADTLPLELSGYREVPAGWNKIL
ncbi:MAG: hypothetical protein K8R76_01825 [Candidatus Aegiribacteria sp.]|nr:hypothetical protein [Candidatus Aegiribacteria sp.]